MNRLLSFFIVFSFAGVVLAQEPTTDAKLHYLRVNLSPKLEQYKASGNENVEALPHLDVGASIYLGNRFTPKIYAEVGLQKIDYSSRLQITTYNVDSEELKAFDKQLYPTFSSVQMALLVGYESRFSEKWNVYGAAGINFFVSRSLDREGSQFYDEMAKNDETGYEEPIAVYTYSNDLEGGNILMRADLGLYRQVSKTLFLDMSIAAKSSFTPINEFEIEYTSNSNTNIQRARLETRGSSVSLNLGVKYRINKY